MPTLGSDIDVLKRNGNALVSIIIPINTAESVLPELLRSLEDQDYRAIQVLVVDDCSVDNGPRIAKESRVIESVVTVRRNMGKSHAVNEGLRVARGEFVVVTDPDVSVGTNLLATWVRAMQADSTLGVAGAHVFYMGHPGILTHSGARYVPFPPHISRMNVNVHDDGISSQSVQDPWLVLDDIYMLRKSAVELVGGYDELVFPMMLEDADLQWRIKLTGFKAQVVGGAKAYHNEPYPGNRRFQHYTMQKLKLLTRNRLILFRRHLTTNGFLVLLSAMGALCMYSYVAARRYSMREVVNRILPALLRSTIEGLRTPVSPNPSAAHGYDSDCRPAK